MLSLVPGFRVGHDTDQSGRTGCTVILALGQGAVAGVDVRGSSPATRETDLLNPVARVERVNAIVLAGGSAFGLAAADGVMAFLAERKVGFETRFGHVPIVPAAAIYDLDQPGPAVHPGPEHGRRAAMRALAAEDREDGRLGAGAGATVGKILGPDSAMPSGVGSAYLRLPSGVSVGALAVVNALGDVIGLDGSIVAGARAADGSFADAERVLLEGAWEEPPARSNTTLGVVATDACLTPTQATKLAQVAQDALALAIRPVHTMFDGDTVFALAGGEGEPTQEILSLGAAAVHTLRLAIIRAVGR